MGDFTRLTRTDWLGLADRFYARLDGTLASLNGPDWERVTPYLGFRARDVLAHMASTIPVNFREVLDRALAGNPAAPPEFDTFARNTREVARRRATPPAALLTEFRRELDAIMGMYRRMSDADWQKPAWFFVGRVRVRSLFLVQFADNVFHERDLLMANRRWTGGLDPEHAAPLVDWFLRDFRPSLFRPDRAAGLRATMRYRLGGPAGGEWTLTVADGACRAELGAPARVRPGRHRTPRSQRGRRRPDHGNGEPRLGPRAPADPRDRQPGPRRALEPRVLALLGADGDDGGEHRERLKGVTGRHDATFQETSLGHSWNMASLASCNAFSISSPPSLQTPAPPPPAPA